MVKEYYRKIRDLLVRALVAYLIAYQYARNRFDLFYLFLIFMLAFWAIDFLYDRYLSFRVRKWLVRLWSNPPKDVDK